MFNIHTGPQAELSFVSLLYKCPWTNHAPDWIVGRDTPIFQESEGIGLVTVHWVLWEDRIPLPRLKLNWGTPKQPMKLQQPRNYNFWIFQVNLLGSQCSSSRQMTTAPPGHHWEATVALTTTAKLQQLRANSREMISQKLNNRCRRSIRFCVASWLLSFQVPLGSLWSISFCFNLRCTLF